MLRTTIATAALGLAVCACNPQGGVNNPRVGQGIVSPSLNSGITSQNGGGARALGNTPNISIGGTGATGTPGPNSRGAAY